MRPFHPKCDWPALATLGLALGFGVGCSDGNFSGQAGLLGGGKGADEKKVAEEKPAESPPAEEEIPDSSPANLPAEITGAFLTCKVQPAEDPERELLGCQLRQKDKDEPVPLGGLMITWSFSTPDGKALVPESLPIKSSSSLHGLFEFAAEDLTGGVQVQLKVEGKDGVEPFEATYPDATPAEEEIEEDLLEAVEPPKSVSTEDPVDFAFHTAFVTPGKYRPGNSDIDNGRFGSLSDADRICDSLAPFHAPEVFSWRAIMGDSTQSVTSRVNNAKGEVRDTNGALITDNPNLFSGSLDGYMIHGPDGAKLIGEGDASAKAWTGSKNADKAPTDREQTTCNDWQSSSGSDNGKSGNPGDKVKWLSDGSEESCNNEFHILCINVPVE